MVLLSVGVVVGIEILAVAPLLLFFFLFFAKKKKKRFFVVARIKRFFSVDISGIGNRGGSIRTGFSHQD